MTGPVLCVAATDEAQRQRLGVALVAVLLLGTALVLVAHAGVVLGLALERAARGDVRVAEVDALLEARLASVPGALASLDDPLPLGVEGRRLSPELLRVRADSAGRARAGVLWALDAQTRLDALGAGVRTATPVSAAIADRIARLPGDSCTAGLGIPADVADRAVTPWTVDSPLALGPLDSATWADLPPPPPGGAPDPAAWFVAGDALLGPGSWSGLLVVDGILEVASGAEVLGWVATKSDLIVRDGARLEGVARVGGVLDIDPGGAIAVAPCGTVARLRDVPRFAFPVAIGATAWPADAIR